jgi:hypothetical protein
MEEKKQLKKLVLKKEQIVNLNNNEMMGIQGGWTTTITTITTSSNVCIATLTVVLNSVVSYTMQPDQPDPNANTFQSQVHMPDEYDNQFCVITGYAEIPSLNTV